MMFRPFHQSPLGLPALVVGLTVAVATPGIAAAARSPQDGSQTPAPAPLAGETRTTATTDPAKPTPAADPAKPTPATDSTKSRKGPRSLDAGGIIPNASITVPMEALPDGQSVLPAFAGAGAGPLQDARAVATLKNYFARVNAEGLDHVRVSEGALSRTMDRQERIRFLVDDYVNREGFTAQLKELVSDFRGDHLTDSDKLRLGKPIEQAIDASPVIGTPVTGGSQGFEELTSRADLGAKLLAPPGSFLLNDGVLPAHAVATSAIPDQAIETLASYFRKFNKRVLDKADVTVKNSRKPRGMTTEERRRYLLDVYVKQEPFVRDVLKQLVPTVKAENFAQLAPSEIVRIAVAIDRALAISTDPDSLPGDAGAAIGTPAPLVSLVATGGSPATTPPAPGATSVIEEAKLPPIVDHFKQMDEMIKAIYRVDPPSGQERPMNEEERKAALIEYGRTPKFAQVLKAMGINLPSPPTVGDMTQITRAAEQAVFGKTTTSPPSSTGGAVVTPDRVAAIREHLEKADDFMRTRRGGRKSATERAGSLLDYVRSEKDDGFRRFLKERFDVAPAKLDSADEKTLGELIAEIVGRPGRPSLLSNINAQTILGAATLLGDVAQDFNVPGVAPFLQVVESPGFSNLIQGIGSSGLFGSRGVVIYESSDY